MKCSQFFCAYQFEGECMKAKEPVLHNGICADTANVELDKSELSRLKTKKLNSLQEK